MIGNVHFKKGVTVAFPIWAIHHDPEFFPEPDDFKPERFLSQEGTTIQPFAYIPFGEGPRKCIGLRFAMVQMKIALAKLLHKYNIVEAPETKLEFHPGDLFFLSFPEVKVKLECRE